MKNDVKNYKFPSFFYFKFNLRTNLNLLEDYKLNTSRNSLFVNSMEKDLPDLEL